MYFPAVHGREVAAGGFRHRRAFLRLQHGEGQAQVPFMWYAGALRAGEDLVRQPGGFDVAVADQADEDGVGVFGHRAGGIVVAKVAQQLQFSLAARAEEILGTGWGAGHLLVEAAEKDVLIFH